MARFELDRGHFTSSYRSPLLREPGERFLMPQNQWPALTWVPLDTDAKAKLAAQIAYGKALHESRVPVASENLPGRVVSERAATRVAETVRMRIYRALLEKLPKDASVEPAMRWLEQLAWKEPALSEEQLQVVETIVAETVDQTIEGKEPEVEPVADESDPEPADVDDSDPMTDRRTVHPSQRPRQSQRERDRAARDGDPSPTTSETWDDAAQAQADAHASAEPGAGARRRNRRAADQEI